MPMIYKMIQPELVIRKYKSKNLLSFYILATCWNLGQNLAFFLNRFFFSKFGNLKIPKKIKICHFEKNSPSGNFFPTQNRSCCFYFLIFSYIAYSLLLQLCFWSFEFLILFLPMASAKYTNRWLLTVPYAFSGFFCVFKLKSEDLSELETCHVPS